MARRTTNDEDGRPSLTHMLQPTVLPSQWAFGANSTSAFLRVTHDGLRCRIALHYVDLHGSPLVDYHSVVVPLHSDADERADPPENLEQFGSAAIRKGILLHRYVTFVGELLNWKWGRLPVHLQDKLRKFGVHFAAEAEAIGDDKLLDEVENWAKLNELAEKQYGKKSKMCAIM